MKVGIPIEINPDEQLVGATPKTVERLIKQGFEVYIEEGAGKKAIFSDEEFKSEGANIVKTPQEIYSMDLVLKVQPPTFDEVKMMKEGLVLLSYLWPDQHPELIKQLAERKVNAIAMDAIPRISRAQKMDVRSSMANVAGYRAVVEGAFHFGRFLNGQITAAGRVEPAKILVIGAGVAGLAAIGVANSLGAIVRAFDTRKEVAEQIESMGAKFLTVEIDEDGSTSSGYSKVMSEAYIKAEMDLFLEQCKDTDIFITTALIPGRPAPKLLMDYHVAAMKPGSVIIDLAASAGGNCTQTKDGEVYTTENGVIIVGKLSQLPTQSSQLYGNNLCHLLDDMGKAANFKIDMEDDVVSRAMVTYQGEIHWPPAPLPVSPQKPKIEVEPIKELTAEEKKALELAKIKKKTQSIFIQLAVIGGLLFLVGRYADPIFMQHFTVFVLSVFVGWNLIWNVTHALHTPLMAITNAISGIIVLGGLLQVTNDLSDPATIFATLAILVASINIVGGFYVTRRMLKMFKK